jgi:hypothetical protein
MYHSCKSDLKLFYFYTMAFFNSIGHEFDVFFGRTLPGVANDIGKFAQNITLDTTRTIGQGIQNLIKPPLTTAKEVATNLVQAGGSELRQTLPILASTARSTLSGVSEITTSLQMPLFVGLAIVGIIVVYKIL